MALTTHERIRVFAGFQHRFDRNSFGNTPNGSETTFHVRSDDPVKFVPEFGSGGTVAGVSDVQVWVGLSGVFGVSRMTVAAIDIGQGSVQLASAPSTGVSLTINYSSSSISSIDIEDARKQAESIINQRIGICYDLPISPTPTYLQIMATRLSAALLLIRGFGTGARDTSQDGYALYRMIMGENKAPKAISSQNNANYPDVGELGMVCSPGYQIIDDNGQPIPRNDTDSAGGVGEDGFTLGGRVQGRIYDITEEQFRFKPFQDDVNREQPGTNNNSPPPVQG